MRGTDMMRPGISGVALRLAALAWIAVGSEAIAQPLTERTPNMGGAWVTSPRNLHFQFAHRFTTSGDTDISDIFGRGKIVNYPTFDLALGLFDGGMAGVRFSSNSPGAGLVNEWQPYLKFAPLRGVGGGALSVALTGAWNGANQSVDGELAAETRTGPFLFTAALRGFSDIYDLPGAVDDEALALAGGVGVKLNRYVTLSGDVADLVAGPDGALAWSAGLNVGIPFTPHTISIMATNVTSGTLAGASAGARTFLPADVISPIFWGFEFTVPFSGFARWGKIFDPDELRSVPGARDTSRRVVEVEIGSIAFRTEELRVPAGTTVRWVNKDPVGHTVTPDASDAGFGSSLIGPGETYEHTFERPGTYPYHCIPHPFMTGRVIVGP